MKLHDIANEYLSVLNEIDEDNILINEKLDEIKLPLENKAVNLAKYITSLTSSTKAIDDEIERLSKMKKSIVNRQQSLMDYLEINMQKCGISKIESPLFKIQFQKCPCKVDVINDSEIPDEYKKVKTEVSIDKVKIKDDLKQGVVIPGIKLLQSEKLVIK